MIYMTGDKHREYDAVAKFCKEHQTSKADLMIVLGDNGVNFYGGFRDHYIKSELSKLPITFLMVRGNHDKRPDMSSYKITSVNHPECHGTFLVEEEFPDLLFACDGSFIHFGDRLALVIGGAYSVDKKYRKPNVTWFPDEQLSKYEKDTIFKKLRTMKRIHSKMPDIILSHTCPLSYKPLPWLPPASPCWGEIDESMEEWLDKVEKLIPYQEWYCGHFHVDCRVDKVRFMYNDIIELRKYV